MEPFRVLAFHEQGVCPRGHRLDVWVPPRCDGTDTERFLECPGCGTLFVVSTATQHPSSRLAQVGRDDDACPGCGGPTAALTPYPGVPACPDCARLVRAWRDGGPDLPASAASPVRCWALRPADVDVRSVDLRGITVSATAARRATAPHHV